jgi:hypothetical protein
MDKMHSMMKNQNLE